MDWTAVDQDQPATVPLPMICRHACAMPFVWKTVEKAPLKKHRPDDEDDVLRIVKDHLGEDVHVTVFADRGVAETTLLGYLTAWGGSL